ncbi:protein SOSEKI 2-like [Musa acuminata AAA Group]|uniref:protein SOSEKI 2-like n=1 Tax=Musa acuminata AAA Group TaxID=214697 RepID=UPI0031D8679A
MEGGGGRGRRGGSSREASPDRARLSYSQQQQQQQQRLVTPPRKVQVIYYLSRNGQLEHPHFIELPHLPNQQLRLRDVMERLTAYRGRGMPSLFSWSCKRSYKNGYVWNDLAENDVIYATDGVEYVLKGSEIIPGAYERFQHTAASSEQPKPLPICHRLHLEVGEDDGEEVEEEGTAEDEEVRGGTRTAGDETRTSRPRYSHRSRGVSTDEIERVEHRTATRAHQPARTELSLDDASPPSSTSSDKPPTHGPGGGSADGDSRRFEKPEETPEPGLTRNSVLIQLITCGSAALKVRSSPGGGTTKAADSKLHHGVVSRLASRADEDAELRRILENPRFCHPLVEDKEYFSGSIAEGSRPPPEPCLEKSSSFREERSSKLGIGGRLEVEEGREGAAKGKCIPGRRKSSGKQQ